MSFYSWLSRIRATIHLFAPNVLLRLTILLVSAMTNLAKQINLLKYRKACSYQAFLSKEAH